MLTRRVDGCLRSDMRSLNYWVIFSDCAGVCVFLFPRFILFFPIFFAKSFLTTLPCFFKVSRRSSWTNSEARLTTLTRTASVTWSPMSTSHVWSAWDIPWARTSRARLTSNASWPSLIPITAATFFSTLSSILWPESPPTRTRPNRFLFYFLLRPTPFSDPFPFRRPGDWFVPHFGWWQTFHFAGWVASWIATRPGRILHPAHATVQGHGRFTWSVGLHVLLHSALRRIWSVKRETTIMMNGEPPKKRKKKMISKQRGNCLANEANINTATLLP